MSLYLSVSHHSQPSLIRLPLQIIRVNHLFSPPKRRRKVVVLWKGLSSDSVVNGILLSFELLSSDSVVSKILLSQPIPLTARKHVYAELLTRIHLNLRVTKNTANTSNSRTMMMRTLPQQSIRILDFVKLYE
ncbi:unnamed protein product [Camellia sinensis]